MRHADAGDHDAGGNADEGDLTARWLAVAESPASSPAATREALTALLAARPRLGATTVLGILSLGPRYKPSRGLLVDPGDEVHRRWERKVEATRALLAAPTAAALVEHELADELADCPELAAEVRAGSRHPTPP